MILTTAEMSSDVLPSSPIASGRRRWSKLNKWCAKHELGSGLIDQSQNDCGVDTDGELKV